MNQRAQAVRTKIFVERYARLPATRTKSYPHQRLRQPSRGRPFFAGQNRQRESLPIHAPKLLLVRAYKCSNFRWNARGRLRSYGQTRLRDGCIKSSINFFWLVEDRRKGDKGYGELQRAPKTPTPPTGRASRFRCSSQPKHGNDQ